MDDLHDEISQLGSLIVPESGFITDYYDAVTPTTEAPAIFHVFIALSLLATVTARSVFVNMGSFNLYPNLYVMLIAASSSFKKSTALNMGKRLIMSLEDIRRKDEACEEPYLMFPDEFSNEALLGLMERRPSGLFCWNEMQGILDYFERGYMTGAKAMFMNLYDCPRRYSRTLKKESILIENPCISIIAATTVEGLAHRIRGTETIDGFLPRFIYVPGLEREGLKPRPPSIDHNAWGKMVDRLDRISRIQHEMVFDPVADVFYHDWYETHHKMMESENEAVLPFLSRLEGTFVKLAMLIRLAAEEQYNLDEHDRILIKLPDTEYAKKMVDLLITSARYMTGIGFYENRESRSVRRVLGIIQQAEKTGVTRSTLSRATTDMTSRVLDACLDKLFDQEVITVQYLKIEDSRKASKVYFHETSQ